MKSSEVQRINEINSGSEDQSVDKSIDQSWIRGSEAERINSGSEDQSVDQSIDQSWIRGSFIAPIAPLIPLINADRR